METKNIFIFIIISSLIITTSGEQALVRSNQFVQSEMKGSFLFEERKNIFREYHPFCQSLTGANHFNGFVLNLGQIEDDGVIFHSDNIYFKSNKIIIRVLNYSNKWDFIHCQRTNIEYINDNFIHILTLTFINSNNIVPIGTNKSQSYFNFIFGNDSSKWIYNAPVFNEIIYHNIYNGIDLHFHNLDGNIKYEYVIQPGADIHQIQVMYEGALLKTDGKDLVIMTPAGDFLDKGLFCYQIDEGLNIPVEARIVLNRNVLSYQIPPWEYDSSKLLIIDPLILSTFLGGRMNDYGYSVALDSNENIYIYGMTVSPDFPTSPGSYYFLFLDIFITQFDLTGQRLISSTLIGGSGSEYSIKMIIDSDDFIYLCGSTNSTNFPVTSDAYDSANDEEGDIFLLKMSSNGSKLLYSTYMGGSDWDIPEDMVIDSMGNIYLVGGTLSPDFPCTPDAYFPQYVGAFMLKFSIENSDLLYSSYFYDNLQSIEIDSHGNIYLGGEAYSSAFPTTENAYDRTYNGHNDAYFVKFTPNFSELIVSSFLGGEFSENAFVMPGWDGSIYVVGITTSYLFPVTPDAYQKNLSGSGAPDIFISKFNPEGSGILYSTYLGGTDFDSYYYGFGADFFTVGSDGSVIGAISTKSRDFPITDDALDKEYNQRFDTVVFRFNPDSSKLIYSTYLGGLGDDHPNFLFSNYLNTVYLTGATSSDDFPTTPGAYDTTHNGGNDAFVLKMRLLPWAPTNLSAVTGSGYVVLNWTPPNDVGPVPIDNYIIYRGLSSSSLEPIATVGNQTWYNDTTTTNGAIYYYAVRASNRYDTGELSLPLKVFAGAPPSAPENLSARPGDFSVELDWSPPSDTGGFNVINYIVYKGLSEDGLTNFTWLGNVTHHVDADVLNGVEYFYAVSAVSIKGEGMRSGVVSVTPGRPPSPPRELRARAEGAGINLTWLPPEDDGDCPILQYIIYRGGAGDEKAEAGRVESSSLSYLEGPFDDGPAWYYQVTAVNAIGESDRSNEAFAVPNRRPSPPRSLSAAHGSGYIELSWEPPLDDGGSPVTGYNIYRGNQSQSESLVVRLQTPLTVYRDTAPEEGRVNFYYITAMNAVGESAPSARTSILADFTPPVVRILSPANGSWVNTTKVTLKGEASDDCGLRSVELSADGASWSPCEGLLAWVGHVELEDGQREIFARAIDLAGNVNYSALTVNVDTVKPEVRILSPSRDTATRDENATVYGTASDDRFLLRVEASTDGASWSPVDGIFSWSLNLSLRNGRNRVQVRALDAAGNSGYASVNITLDRGAPRITIMAPSDGQRLRASGPALTVRLKGSASDDFGLERVELSSDGKKWVVASGLEVWWGNLTLGPGEHRLRARAIDIAGNIGEADVRVVVEPRTYLFDGLDISLIAISLVVAVVLAGPALMLVRRRRRRGRKVPGP